MKPQHTDLRRMALVAVSAAALVVAVMVVPADADSSGSSSRSQVSRSSGSSGGSSASSRGSSGSSSRSGVSSRSGGSSSQGSGAVRSRSSGSSVSGSSGSRGRAVVTRPSHGRVPPRSSGGGHHFHHGSPHSFHHFRFGFFGYYPYWSWGYPYYGYGYGYYPPVVYASTPGYGMGALDLNVQPKQTEVFVNGQYVGLVKQYDGFPGYLWLESGLYQVAFYRPGYETVFREFEIFTGMVLDVAIEMVPGEAVLPQRAEERPAVQGASGRDPRVMTVPSEQAPPVPYERSRGESRSPAQAASTHVDLSVEPEEASVYLDGRFVGTGRELADGLTVAAGQHVMEVVLPGYEQETVRFEAQPGLDSAVDVRLEPVGSTGG